MVNLLPCICSIKLDFFLWRIEDFWLWIGVDSGWISVSYRDQILVVEFMLKSLGDIEKLWGMFLHYVHLYATLRKVLCNARSDWSHTLLQVWFKKKKL